LKTCDTTVKNEFVTELNSLQKNEFDNITLSIKFSLEDLAALIILWNDEILKTFPEGNKIEFASPSPSNFNHDGEMLSPLNLIIRENNIEIECSEIGSYWVYYKNIKFHEAPLITQFEIIINFAIKYCK
jgi:hypothetical protein